MKKVILLLFFTIQLIFSSQKKIITITPSIETGLNLVSIVSNENNEIKPVAELATSVDVKYNLKKINDSWDLEIGGGLRQGFRVDKRGGYSTVYGVTNIYTLLEIKKLLKENLEFYTLFRFGPGISYGVNKGTQFSNGSKSTYSMIGDIELGTEYKNFRIGLVMGGNFPITINRGWYNTQEGVYPQYRLNLKLGYDIKSFEF